MDPDEVRYRLMMLIESDPQLTQREAANALGISLGKVNYCLRALSEKGLIKLNNFRTHPDKSQYSYLLTPSGVEAKARATLSFLKRKMAEYETLKTEIDALHAELRRASTSLQTDFLVESDARPSDPQRSDTQRSDTQHIVIPDAPDQA